MKIENNVLVKVDNSDIKNGEFVIPEFVTSIDGFAFAHCHNLTSIVIPDSVTNVGNGAFYDCSNLASVSISNSVTSIEPRAFFECINMASIIISANVRSIRVDAFKNCTALNVIHIVAKTKEDYERVKNLLPETLQQKAQSCYEFRAKAAMILAAHKYSSGFFDAHTIPTEIIPQQLFILAKLYKIPPFLLNQTYHQLGFDTEMASNVDNKSNLTI